VAFTAVSNVLGTINPVTQIIKAIREINPGVIVVVDAAQAAPHTGIDVQLWDADFIVLSAHKMLGPTGVGVLWGKNTHLEQMRPVQYGGEMVLQVKIEDSTFKELPHKLEAGTPNIAGVIAFKEAIKYIENLDIKSIREHEKELTQYAIAKLHQNFGEKITIIGTKNPDLRAGILSFSFDSLHSHDIAQLLDEKNIAVRAGHHCTMPLHNHLNLTSSTRASFYIYTTKEDVDCLIDGLRHVTNTLSK
jgi:cysteine desulfurase/selenocysteine lyase